MVHRLWNKLFLKNNSYQQINIDEYPNQLFSKPVGSSCPECVGKSNKTPSTCNESTGDSRKWTDFSIGREERGHWHKDKNGMSYRDGLGLNFLSVRWCEPFFFLLVKKTLCACMLTGRFSVYVYMHEHMHVESGGLRKHFAPPLLAWNLPIRLTSKPQGSSHLYHLSTGVASICHHHSQHFYMGSGDLTQVIMLERQEFTYQMTYPHGPLFFNIIFFFPPTTLSSYQWKRAEVDWIFLAHFPAAILPYARWLKSTRQRAHIAYEYTLALFLNGHLSLEKNQSLYL